jgi:hypothetical protein
MVEAGASALPVGVFVVVESGVDAALGVGELPEIVSGVFSATGVF